MFSRQWIRQSLDGVAQDLRYGMRTLRRSPLATSIMVGSVTLGVGVATAVFTLADAMLLRPPPFKMADRLVVPYQTLTVRSRARQDTISWSFARYDVLRRAVPGLDDAGFVAWVDGIVRAPEQDKPVRIEAVTRTLLTTFSIHPQAGRLFGNDEDAGEASATVGMISDRLWRTVFGSSDSIVGAKVIVNAAPVTIVGVMPKGFIGFSVGADVWLPVRMMARIDPSERWTERLAAQQGTVIGRMAPGMTLPLLQKYLDAALPIVSRVASERFVAPDADRGVGVMTLAEARRHPLVRPILRLLAVAVLGLLLIVCSNVASILVARGHSRRGEIGVRLAIGASRRRVGRQVLTESLLLGVLALPLAILLGAFCADGLANLRPALPQTWVLLRGTDLLAGASLSPNLHVLAFSSMVGGLATLLFGIGPAIAASRVDPAALIMTFGSTHASPPTRGRQLLVISQVALATILLITAGLVVRSVRALLSADLGFQPKGVVALHLVSTDTSADARLRRQQLVTRLAGIAAVKGVAMSGCTPFDLACFVSLGVRAIGNPDANARPVDVELHSVTSGYFSTMRIAIVAGRAFVPEDTTVGHTRVVLSESAARRLYGTSSAVGMQVAFAQERARPMDVVGVARDARFKSVETAESPAIYFLSGEDAQSPRFDATLFVRADLPPDVAISTVGQEIRATNAPMAIGDARSLDDIVRTQTSSTRFLATLLVGFAAAAVLLAAFGIYGVIAYVITLRTREFGVRLVLGAGGRDLLRSVLGRGAVLVGCGAIAGVIGAAIASRLISSFLYGVGSLDIATYSVVIVIVAGIGLLATFLPARRVTRLDPADALRA
jgi:putative ABC transport system permease protein